MIGQYLLCNSSNFHSQNVIIPNEQRDGWGILFGMHYCSWGKMTLFINIWAYTSIGAYRMFQIVSGMPLRLKFMNICTRRQITMLENSDPKRFANAISDNRFNPEVEYWHRYLFSIEKSTEQIQFENFISQSQVCTRSEIECYCNPSSFLFGHVTNWWISKKISGTLLSVR